MVGSVVAYGVYFFFYRICKKIFLLRRNMLNSVDILFITAIAGSITTVVTTPIWLIQTRMCVDETGKKTVFGHMKDIYKEGGIRAFWKGLLPSLVLVINPIINFLLYEYMRKRIVTQRNKSPTFSSIFGISVIAKFMATAVTYPILTLKTRAFTNNKKNNYAQLIQEYLQKEGVMALYRGLYTKLFQTLLYNAFMMMSFEKIRHFCMSLVGHQTY